MIPTSHCFDQTVMEHLLMHDPLVVEYRAFFSLLDWSLVETWQQQRSSRGRPPTHPESAYLKAFLLRVREKLSYTVELRDFLIKHPLLIIECGFQLVLDPHAAFGFDAEQTLPSRFWLGEKLKTLDPSLLQRLLASTVTALRTEIPGLGETVAFDVKHIYAWVKENNWRTYIKDRYDKQQTLVGDPDCKLGVKRRSNEEQEDGSIKEKPELIWGYGSGVAAATTPDYGDVVLAEYTQPFNENDITYFRPLYQQTVVALNLFPTNITADKAFDAWYVYETAARHGGIGAIPLNGHGHQHARYDRDGVPMCEKGLRMIPGFQFAHTHGYRAQQFLCPLLHPQSTGETCHHAQFLKGMGCKKNPNWELGGRMRISLDRENPLYKAIYTQRTSCERINSQAKELGIERPRVHNRRSVANLNTLIYVIINVHALQRAISINKGLLQMN